MTSTLKHPSAWIPLLMSFAAIALLLGYLAMFGVVRQEDEGTAAHIWQILMVGQLPFIAFFALKWLPQAPKQAFMVLALQLLAGLAACAPVFYFQL